MSKAIPSVTISELRENLEYAKKHATDPDRWYENVLKFIDWKKPKQPSSGKGSSVKYINIQFNPVIGDRSNKRFLTNVIINEEEFHRAFIAPNSQEEAARLTEQLNFKDPINPRKYDIIISIKKYKTKVETEDDGITVKTDEKGDPIYPDDSQISSTYTVLALLSEAFTLEFNYQRKKKVIYIEDVDEPVRGAVRITSSKRFTPIQQIVKDGPKEGMPLPNPISRLKVVEDKETNRILTKFLDHRTMSITEGRIKKFEPLMVDGDPLGPDNIHKAITSGTIIKAGSFKIYVSISMFGTSLTTKLNSLIVDPYVYKKNESLEDEYGDMLVATDEEIETIGITKEPVAETKDGNVEKVVSTSAEAESTDGPTKKDPAGPSEETNDEVQFDLGALDDPDDD